MDQLCSVESVFMWEKLMFLVWNGNVQILKEKRGLCQKMGKAQRGKNPLPLTEGLLCAKQCWILQTYFEPQEVIELSLKTKTYLWDTRRQNPLSKKITLKHDACQVGEDGIQQYLDSNMFKTSKWAIFNPAIHLLRIYLAQVIRRAWESGSEN